MNSPAVILEPGKDKAVRNRHHWIYSGAIRKFPEPFDNGSILAVRSAGGEHLGFAYFNTRTSIAGRMLSFDATPAEESVRKNLDRALTLRKTFIGERTNAFRLVNAEGDGLPGLVADIYGDVGVLQIATLGMEKLKPVILAWLLQNLGLRSIYEKSNLPARREEGLPDFEGVLHGDPAASCEILEDGLRYLVEILHSQKTGFFLDQREMRRLVAARSASRTVLNAFSYTGAFSVCALQGGARLVDSVDTSLPALETARRNLVLNGFDPAGNGFAAEDVFAYLRRMEPRYDFIILDPPAFAKRRADVVQACRGYKDINRLAIQKVLPKGLVMTFSCSHFVDEGLFRQVVFQAAAEARREVRILQRHRQAFDHPLNIFHPETEYLKGFLLYVD